MEKEIEEIVDFLRNATVEELVILEREAANNSFHFIVPLIQRLIADHSPFKTNSPSE